MLWIAHRAGTDRYPEQSMEAAAFSLAHGADFVELDVRFTADGAPVICHDPSALRMFGVDCAVADMTLETFLRLRNRSHPQIAAYSLKDAFEAGLVPALLHLKCDAQALDTVLEHVARFGYQERVVLGTLGIAPVRWLNEPGTAFWCIAFVTMWRLLGYDTIVFIGGIQNISGDVLEAATIDGASRLDVIRHIIFPLTSPTTFMLMILNTITILKMFTVINVLTGGGPAKSTQNLVIMLHDYAFNRFQIGYASAISTVLFLIILVIHAAQRTLERKVQYEQ